MPAQVRGSGTPNYVPIWTSTSTIGNSNMFQSAGMVGVGTTSPAASFAVKGQNGTSNAHNAPTALQVTGGAGFSVYPLGLAGIGGAIQLTSGPGGGSGVNGGTGGQGGPIYITGSKGGDAGFGYGGKGGSIQITGGPGGTGSTGTGGTGGNGGSITLQPGTGGTGSIQGRTGNIVIAPSGGNVGIGETSPGNTFEVKMGGTTLADAWGIRSSRRFKMNIHPLEGALEKVALLQGVSYQRKPDGKPEIGMVAEDVSQVIPEVVLRDPNTQQVEGIDYSRLVALLIEAIKAQQSDIQQLRYQVEQLTSVARGQ